MPEKIFRKVRLQKILEQIKKERIVNVDDLASKFNVSTSSIRIDLTELDELGLITRIYGGAILPEDAIEEQTISKSGFEQQPRLEIRFRENLKQKEAIGKLAANFITDGDTVIVDGGSTTQFLVKYLAHKKYLTIITNSLPQIPNLIEIKESEIYLLGGLVYKENLFLSGDFTLDSLEKIHVQKAFLGMDGISLDKGLTVANPSASTIVAVKKKMIESSDEIYILCDSSKIGRKCLVPLAPLNEMDYLISDEKIPTDFVNHLRSMNIKVEIANISPK